MVSVMTACVGHLRRAPCLAERRETGSHCNRQGDGKDGGAKHEQLASYFSKTGTKCGFLRLHEIFSGSRPSGRLARSGVGKISRAWELARTRTGLRCDPAGRATGITRGCCCDRLRCRGPSFPVKPCTTAFPDPVAKSKRPAALGVTRARHNPSSWNTLTVREGVSLGAKRTRTTMPTPPGGPPRPPGTASVHARASGFAPARRAEPPAAANARRVFWRRLRRGEFFTGS